MSDPLRTGAIFKLDLNKVRSPPVVKFTVPDVPKSAVATQPSSSAKKDSIKDAFNEIYRRTPIPAILLGVKNNNGGSAHSRQWHSPEVPSSLTRLMNNSNDEIQDTDDEACNTITGGRAKGHEQAAVTHHSLQKRKNMPQTAPNIRTDTAPLCDEEHHGSKRSRSDSNSKPAVLTSAEPRSRLLNEGVNNSSASTVAAWQTVRQRPPAAGSPTLPASATRGGFMQVIPRSNSAPSRGSSRTRCGGDSLLMLAAAPPSANATATSKPTAQDRTASSVNPLGRTASAHTENIRTKQTEQKPVSGRKSISGSSRVAETKAVSASDEQPEDPEGTKERADSKSDDDIRAGLGKGSAAPRRGPPGSRNVKSVNPNTTKAAGLKCKAAQAHSEESVGSSSEQSSSDEESSVEEQSTQQGKSTNRRSGAGASKKSLHAVHLDNEVGEKDPTITRSGRTSIPKKIIPTIGESDEPKVKGRGRGRPRQSGSPTKVTSTATSAVSVPSGKVLKQSAGQGKKAAAVGKGRGKGETQGSVEPSEGSAWQPKEIIALYSVQGRVDISAPDFWDIVSDELAEMGVFRTSEECNQRWFESVREAEARKKANAEKKRLKEQQPSGPGRARSSTEAPQHNLINASQASGVTGPENAQNTSTDATESVPAKATEPVKNKRMGKAEMKRLAQESLKAAHDDDIFESSEMQSYFNPGVVEQDALLDLLDSLDLPEGDLPAFGESIPSSAMANGANSPEEEEPMFASAHVHKLHYKPQFKVPRAGAAKQSSESHPHDKVTNFSGLSKAGTARMMKNGVVNAELVRRQARADLGVRADASEDDDSEDEGSGGDSQEE